LAATLGLGAYQLDPDFRLPLEQTSVESWGDALHALKTVAKALGEVKPLRNLYDYTAERFAAVVEFAEIEAERLDRMGLRLRSGKRAQDAAYQASIFIKEEPAYASEVQGNSTPTIVLSVLGAR
jgi:hypothetical protein